MSHNKTILIVDDERSIREALSEALELSGYLTTAVPSGEEAFKVLNSGAEKPSLIFLDLMMPVMDGIEFIRAKEMMPELNKIPTIIISADGRAESKLKGCSNEGCLKKPIDLDRLLEVAEKYCG